MSALDLEPGYYWLQEIESGKVQIAEFIQGKWELFGAIMPFTTDQILNERPMMLIGPRIEPPSAGEITLQALS